MNRTFKTFALPLTLLVLMVFPASFGGCKPPAPLGSEPAAAPTPPSEIWKEFSGEKALDHTRAQVEIGPRIPGSPELEKTRALITAELERNGWTVERQTFTDNTPRGPTQFVNLIGRYGKSTKTQQFIVCSHYDTKIFDTFEFVGASDGASSTGALMELSRVLALDPSIAERVELVFFDGEEAFVQFTETDGLYGSRYYAKNLRETGKNRQFKAGVLWDMIGDRDLTITLSPDSPPEMTQAIFAAADALQARHYFSFHDRPIWDDHIPLNLARIPTINLIDFNYVYWHTADDTLDKLSPKSLQTIGAITLHWLKTTVHGPLKGATEAKR
jgi:glutaminyl-peptide cyclotransferase